MTRTSFLFFLAALVCACDRYPSQLSEPEQIQVLIFQHLASQPFNASSKGDDALRLFLCCGTPQGDPSPAVQAYVARSFRSARPCSAVAPGESDGGVRERGTGRAGIELEIKPFSLTNNGPVTIRASYFVHGKDAEGFDYRVQRIKGRWTILDRKQVWIS